MSNSIEQLQFQIKRELILHESSQIPIFIRTVTITLAKQDDRLIECRLTFHITPELYQHINTNGLFNLNPSLRLPLTNGDFQPSPDIQIEATLKPEFLPHLQEHATTSESAAAYLLSLNQSTKDPLLNTESWLALSVKQPQESGETGYRTFWSYLTPEALLMTDTSGEQISKGVTQFCQDLFGSSLESASQNFTAESLAAISNIFKGLSLETPEVTPPKTESKQPIFQAIINFFTEDDWSFQKIASDPALRLVFQGDNGKWYCYAKAREEQQQFVFYSICPVNVPENKRIAIAEFINRANYGTVIGNFELDYTDGEIRYKTSIDVEGSNLTFPLIKQLVYTNVTMMDEYLPGILSVIEGDVEPKDAIAKIET
jgi:hypothetical protein